MKINILLISLLCLIILNSNQLNAQQILPLDEESYYKNLQTQLNNAENDSVKASVYLLYADFWRQKEVDKSEKALREAKHYACNYSTLEGNIYFLEGQLFADQKDPTKARLKYNKAINTLKNIESPLAKKILAAAWYNYGLTQYQEKGYVYLTNILTNKSIPLVADINMPAALAHYYSQLGTILMSVGQFDQAIKNLNQALEILDTVPEEETVRLITYFSLISTSCYQANSVKAKEYLNKANAIIQKYPNSQLYPNYYLQAGTYYTTTGDNKKAIEELTKGIGLAKKAKQIQTLQVLQFRLYNNYYALGQYGKAKQLLENMIAEGIITKEVLNRKTIFSQLAEINALMSNHKEAYSWEKKAAQLSDSIQSGKLVEKVNELEVLHQTTKKENTIHKLKQKNVQAELEKKNKDIRIIALVCITTLLLLILLLLFYTYRNQKKLNKQIALNYQQQLQQAAKDNIYKSSQALLQGEEQERLRIAQDLHDSIGGMLTSIRFSLVAKPADYQVQNTLDKVDSTIQEMRRIARNLMPETLQQLGLELAVKELCDLNKSNTLAIQFEAFDLNPTWTFEVDLAIYRIIQESINNIIKHAQATHVIIQLSQINNTLLLTIEDNGKGFDINGVNHGLGLQNIQNRATLIQAKLTLISAPGEGTTINLEYNG